MGCSMEIGKREYGSQEMYCKIMRRLRTMRRWKIRRG